MIKPRQPAPALEVDLLDGGRWSLAEQSPEAFTLVVVYRGLHCPICSTYLADLNNRVAAFRERGVEPIAISSDPRDRAEQAREKWGLDQVPVAYGLSLEAARDWGLFISSGRGRTSAGVEEPERFPEPGLFLVKPDGTLYAGAIQTMPFARPSFADLIKAVDFVKDRDYPARGEV